VNFQPILLRTNINWGLLGSNVNTKPIW